MSVETHSRPPRLSLTELVKGALSTAVGTIHTRLEIISTEIEEERERLEEMVVFAIGLAFCVCMGVLVLSLLVVALFWDTPQRLYALGAMGVFYLVVAGVLWGILKSKVRNKPRLFATTLAELAKDRHALQGELSNNNNNSH